MKVAIKSLLKILDADLHKGDFDFFVCSIKTSVQDNSDSIAFIDNKNITKESIKFKAKSCITSSTFVDDLDHFQNILVSKNPRLSFARLTGLFSSNLSKKVDIKVAQNSFVDSGAELGKNVCIGNYCTIEKNVSIGDNTTIGHNVTIYSGSRIGSNVSISSGVIIGSQGFGFARDDNYWVHIHHLGGVIIGDYSHIGSNTCIDRGTLDNTVIGNNVIIDNSVHIAHNVNIGHNTAIAAKVGVAGSTSIGKRCQIGGMVGIFGHLKICDNVVVTPKSNVYRSINSPGHYTSLFPILPHSLWKKVSILLAKLDKIRNLLKK